MPIMYRPREAQRVVDKMNNVSPQQRRKENEDKTFTKVSDARPNPRTAGYVR
jgi:hypothetical protein